MLNKNSIQYRKKKIQKIRVLELASLIAIKYGGPGNKYYNRNFDQIRDLWKYEQPYPSLRSITSIAKVKEIKWFIHNVLSYTRNDIWTPDFLMGLSIHGKISWNKLDYPSFFWRENESVSQLISSCPYGGIIRKDSWLNVPAFYLKHSNETMSYMAGAFSGTQIIEENGFQYCLVNHSSLKTFKSWGIPIDKIRNERLGRSESYLISPIWPALFSIKMPEGFGDKWLQLNNPYGVKTYAPILWRTYIDSMFPKDGLPYLQSRRSVYNHFGNGNEDLVTNLNKIRVEKGMTEIDGRIKEIVKIWANKIV